MAQLPPRSSNSASIASSSTRSEDNSSWVDEFLNFSAVNGGVHRRSASDSIAFLDADLALNDDQLLAIFSDIDNVPATTSGDNGANELTSDNSHGFRHQRQLKNELKEDEDCQVADPKRVKRVLANRQSAQRSRVRKLQYITQLERSVTALQTKVMTLSPRVAYLDHQRSVLTVGNSALRQRIAALAQDKIFKDAHQEALKKEVERLRQLYHQQSSKSMHLQHTSVSPIVQTNIGMDTITFTEEELLIS